MASKKSKAIIIALIMFVLVAVYGVLAWRLPKYFWPLSKEYPKNRTEQWISLGVAGVLLILGIIILIVGLKKKKGEEA